MILKFDLAKAHDIINWLYIRLVLLQIGMNLHTVNWIMGCLSSASFLVLINGSPSSFFNASRRLQQGFSFSPFLFLLVAEGLSRMILEAKSEGFIQGIQKLMRLKNYFLGLNMELDTESTKEELKAVLTSFKKAKIPSPNG
jgi:hypothetical protein